MAQCSEEPYLSHTVILAAISIVLEKADYLFYDILIDIFPF